jgi:hypothetical protein
MSKIARMMQQASAGVSGGLEVDSVFAVRHYHGTGGTHTINNGIDLSTEGGLVWTKRTSSSNSHYWYDTERGVQKYISSNLSDVEYTSGSGGLNQFNNNGYRIGNDNSLNNNNSRYASYCFRKCPNFFDIVTYTGNGANNRAINHNLGAEPGMVIIKRLSGGAENWAVYHIENSPNNDITYLDTNVGSQNTPIFSDERPTSTQFKVDDHPASNNNGDNYIAYIFASHDGSGGRNGTFGKSGDQPIIECGKYYASPFTHSYYGSAVKGNPRKITLGWEPQWIMIKNMVSGDWYIADETRGANIPNSGTETLLIQANTNAAEHETPGVSFLSDGFYVWDTNLHQNYRYYIYMAVRKGPIDPVTDVTKTDVFATDTWGGGDGKNTPAFYSGFPTDFAFMKPVTSGGSWEVVSKNTQLRKTFLDQNAQMGNLSSGRLDFENGFYDSTASLSSYRGWMWQRSPKIMDLTSWVGTGSGGHVVKHNLQATPEAAWTFNVDSGPTKWYFFETSDVAAGKFREGSSATNGGLGEYNLASGQRVQAIDDTSITWGNGQAPNGSGGSHYAILWATYPDIVKVGKFTYSYPSSAQTVDCGFSNGARMVIIKRVTSSGNFDSWFVWDSVRGITTNADNFLRFDTTAAQTTDGNNIEPHSSGFKIVNGGLNLAAGTQCYFIAFA